MNTNPGYYHSQFRSIQETIFTLDSDSLFEYLVSPKVLVTTKNYLSVLLGPGVQKNERAFLYAFIIYRFPYEVFEKEQVSKVSHLYKSRIELIKRTKELLDILYDYQEKLDSVEKKNTFFNCYKDYISSFFEWKELNRQFVISQTIHKLNKLERISNALKDDPFIEVKIQLYHMLELLGVRKEEIPNIELNDETPENDYIPFELIRKQIISKDFTLTMFYLEKITISLGIPFDKETFSPTNENLNNLFVLISNKVFKPDSHILLQFKDSIHSDISNLIPYFLDSVLSILSQG